jgi:hypothetical protein
MRKNLLATWDVAGAALPWIPHQNRYGLRSLTRQELTAALAGDVRDAQIDEMTLEMSARGAADGGRLCLRWNATGESAQLPRSVYVKGTPSTTTSRLILAVYSCHVYETRFYREIQPAIPAVAPRAYLGRSGTAGRYVVALQDLGAEPAAGFFAVDAPASPAHANAVIDTLARLHGAFWRSPRLAADLAWLPSHAERPGYPLLKRLLRWSERRFAQQERALPPTVLRVGRLYADNQDRVARLWGTMPETVAHGDCHVANTFRRADGTAGLHDWQTPLRTTGLLDVAAFVMFSLPTEDRRVQERPLLERYLAGLAERGAGADAPSFDAAWDAYRMLTIEGWMGCMMTLAVGGMLPDDAMETIAARAATALVDLEVEQVLRRRL